MKQFGLYDGNGKLMFHVSLYPNGLYELTGVERTFYSGKHWKLTEDELNTFIQNDKLTKEYQTCIFEYI
ncbi:MULTISPECIES: hypothetical protein [Staphylococcus]|uniref:hypothetical protein n=1 Tax=Staphylococcus TaxID=1279 RepID=UPI0006941099|nr:hypothetical protein [Staphylococcus saprophyticus]